MGHMRTRNIQITHYQFLQKFFPGYHGVFNRQVNYLIKISLESFENIEIWLKELKTHSNPDAKVFLIGNKVDLEEKRKVDKEIAFKFKNDYSLDLFMEASAKTGFNAKSVRIII